MTIDKFIEKTPVWLWATILLGFLSLFGFSVLYFGYAGVGKMRVTVSSVGEGEEVSCIVEIDYREISKATDYAKGCMKWRTEYCVIAFGSMCGDHDVKLSE